MYNQERSEKRRLYVASFGDDIPQLRGGALIPRRTLYTAPTNQTHTLVRVVWFERPAVLLALSVILFALSIGTTLHSVMWGASSIAAPIAAQYPDMVIAPQPFISEAATESYQEVDTHSRAAQYLQQGVSFIEITLAEKSVQYHASGTVVEPFAITYAPETDDWLYVPAGEYQVTALAEEQHIATANVTLPWSIALAHNHYLHGTPHEPGVAAWRPDPSAGLQLSDTDAKALFALATTGMPVVVHAAKHTPDDHVYAPEVPGVTARQYVVADITNSVILAGESLNETAAIASLTKLMTALVVAEQMDLERTLTVPGGSSTLVTSLVPRLAAGQRTTVYELLQLLLVESSNEAAEVLARAYGRSEFIGLMNDTARAIGMHDTTFADPSGLDNTNQSSAADLFRLLQYIYYNRGFILQLTAAGEVPDLYTARSAGTLHNFNEIKGSNFLAGKVGETGVAGQTSLSLHEVIIDGRVRQVVVVLLGSSARSTDVTELLAFVTDRY